MPLPVPPGTLILAGAPLGDPADASTRLREALATAPVIAAEDTRRLRRLATALGITPAGRIVSYFEGNEAARLPHLLDTLRAGTDVLVVTDAGMPGVSDPGYRLVRAAYDVDIPVTALPGPSAVTTALVLSGLPTDRFCFEGFPPRRNGPRRAAFSELRDEKRTLIFFESPRRLADTLTDLAEAFGPDRPAAVCREMTKTHQEVRRGPLAELAEWATGGVLGEVTLVVGGAPAVVTVPDAGTLAGLVADMERYGESRKEAIAAVARAVGAPKRVVFDAVVAAKREPNEGG